MRQRRGGTAAISGTSPSSSGLPTQGQRDANAEVRPSAIGTLEAHSRDGDGSPAPDESKRSAGKTERPER